MKRLLALGLAAIVAAGAIITVTTAGPASARMWMRPYPYFPHPYPRSGFYFSFPSPWFGFNYGPTYYPRYQYYSSPHVAWCASHYRTYSSVTNTYFIRPGVPAVCYSPYG